MGLYSSAVFCECFSQLQCTHCPEQTVGYYLKDTHLTRAYRSAMAKIRCGIAPICLETGRYEGLTEQE